MPRGNNIVINDSGNFNQLLDTLDKRLVQLNKSIVMVVKPLP